MVLEKNKPSNFSHPFKPISATVAKRDQSHIATDLDTMQAFIASIPTGQGCRPWGVPGVPWHPQILAEQLTLSQPERADYAHQKILASLDFQTFLRP